MTWKTYGEIAHFVRGSRKVAKTDGNVPIIGAGAKPCGYTDEPNAPYGTITISNQGSVGKVYQWDTPIFANEYCYMILPHQGVLSEFLLHYLLKDEHRFAQMHGNQTIKKLDIDRVKATPFYVPSQIEQIEIIADLNMRKMVTELTEMQIKQLNTQYEFALNELLNFK